MATLAANPTAGDEIPGTGGARKLQFAERGQGKGWGYRVITFYSGTDVLVFLLSLFAKDEFFEDRWQRVPARTG